LPRPWQRKAGGPPRAGALLAALLASALLAGCTSGPVAKLDRNSIAPLMYEGRITTFEDALALVEDEDLLAVNDAMRAFVSEYTDGIHNQRSRLLALHTAVKSPGGLDLEYDPFADGSAADAFARGTANCLSYANLFVALAREAGLDARYQWMEIRPEWQRLGDRVAVRLHVNVTVKTRDGDEYMIDIDPLRRNEVAGSRVLSDRDAKALYYSNVAMQSFAEGRLEEGWMQTVRALELSPDQSHLWVNLGAIYRQAEQYAEAEQAYFRALAVDRADRSAMNNLVVLYGFTGRHDEEAYWEDRMRRYRDRNPYYHSNLGDVAGEQGNWDLAFEHYTRAVELHPDDSELIYALGVIEHQRGNYDEATALIEQAIDKANFAVDEQNYRIHLRAIEKDRAASL
jgi:Flp pilus assembly protein TadD